MVNDILPDESVVTTMNDKIQCSHCHRYFPRKEYYVDKDGNPMKKCKKCMASLIDLGSPSTIMDIMKEVDVPFIPAEWNSLRDRYEFSINKATGRQQRNSNANQSVLGRYLGKMKLAQYKDFKFSDTDKFMEEHEKEVDERKQEIQNRLDNLLEEGYDTDVAVKMLSGEIDEVEDDVEIGKRQLRDLRLKWGKGYTKEELIQLETFYSEMHASYDITTASHEDYLKQIVKVSLRMNSLIDQGAFDEYQKLSSVYDRMMKSAKFTASQEKIEDRFVDSISEMVKICEQQGFIPIYHTDEPQDIVDVTLKDFTNYVKNLVMKELNLDSLIEKGMEQIKLDEEKANMSADDALFDEEDLVTDDDLLFEAMLGENGEFEAANEGEDGE